METSAPSLRRSKTQLRRIGSELRPFRGVALTVLGLALVFWAQFDLAGRHFSLITLLLLVAGAVLATAGAIVAGFRPLIVDVEARPVSQAAPRDWPRWRLLALPWIAVFTVMAYSLSEFGRFSVQGVIVWALAIVLLFVAWWQPAEMSGFSLWRSSVRAAARIRGRPLSLVAPIAAFLLVAGPAAFFRFKGLSGLPADAGSAEAGIGEYVKNVLDGQFWVYMPKGVGEGGLVYVTAGLVKVLKVSLDYSAIKVTSAIAGLLAVGVTYLLLKELFADRLIALIGALLMAVAHWPVTLSRSSFMAASAPLFAALTLLFLVRALKHNRMNDFLVCGLLAGAGLYFSEGLRALPFLILACLAVKFVAVLLSRRKSDLFPLLGRSALLGLMLLVVFAPMARAWYDHPKEYLWTLDAAAQTRNYDAAGRVVDNAKKLPLMFVWEGDAAYRSNIPKEPALDKGMAAFLVMGVVLAGVAWLRYRRGMFPYAAVAFAGLLAPSAFSLASPADNPSMTLSAGAIPLVFGFAAVPVALGLSAAARPFSQRTGLAVASVVLLGLTAGFAVFNYNWYFHDYRDSTERIAAPTVDVALAIDVVKSRDPRIQSVFVITREGWTDLSGVIFMLGQPDWIEGDPGLPETLAAPESGEAMLYVVPEGDSTSRERLKDTYPQGMSEWHEIRDSGMSFVLFTTLPAP